MMTMTMMTITMRMMMTVMDDDDDYDDDDDGVVMMMITYYDLGLLAFVAQAFGIVKTILGFLEGIGRSALRALERENGEESKRGAAGNMRGKRREREAT